MLSDTLFLCLHQCTQSASTTSLNGEKRWLVIKFSTNANLVCNMQFIGVYMCPTQGATIHNI